MRQWILIIFYWIIWTPFTSRNKERTPEKKCTKKCAKPPTITTKQSHGFFQRCQTERDKNSLLFHYRNCHRTARTLQIHSLLNMNAVLLICVLIFSLYGEGFCFLNGFPKEQCNEMDPTKIKVDDSMIKELESHINNTHSSIPIVLPKSLKLSGNLNLYKIATSSSKYRRGRTLDSKFFYVV